jgi:hypothetical protein
VNPDESLAENFVFGDLAPGDYELVVYLQGLEVRRPVVVDAGGVTTAEIVIELMPQSSVTDEPAPATPGP